MELNATMKITAWIANAAAKATPLPRLFFVVLHPSVPSSAPMLKLQRSFTRNSAWRQLSIRPHDILNLSIISIYTSVKYKISDKIECIRVLIRDANQCLYFHRDNRLISPGFAAIDALVSLTILAVSIGLLLKCLAGSERAVSAALELRQADALIARLLVQPGAGAADGEAGGFHWRVDVKSDPSGPGTLVALCKTTAVIESRRSHRSYRGFAVAPCPVQKLI